MTSNSIFHNNQSITIKQSVIFRMWACQLDLSIINLLIKDTSMIIIDSKLLSKRNLIIIDLMIITNLIFSQCTLISYLKSSTTVFNQKVLAIYRL